MSNSLQAGTMPVVLVALALIAAALTGGGALLASGEEQLLREAARIAAESPLAAAPFEEPPPDDASWEIAVKPKRQATGTGVIEAGTGPDLAVHRAVQFLMTQGCIEEGRRVIALLGRGLVRVGPGEAGFEGIAVPRHCAELTPAEEADAQRGLPRTVTLARALLVGLWSLPAEGQAHTAKPSPIAAWTRTLETMSSWVRVATRAVEETARTGGDQHMPAWHALVLVEAMRAALRDYGDLGWCQDGRGESWEALSASLARTRLLLKKKLSAAPQAG